MCGRFVRKRASADYASYFKVPMPELPPSYNVAPSQPVLAIRGHHGQPQGAVLRWGLIPFWSKDGTGFINARAETVAKKPAFRDAFRRHRCLVVGDGYFEWRAEAGGKQPYYFRPRNDEPIGFAGLWDRWHHQDEVIESCAVIVTEANELSRPIHDRMPVILSRETCEVWLDHAIEDADKLKGLLKPYPADEMLCSSVSRAVNSPKNDNPELIVAVSA
jgi:putative SOS response-associated peptidase YedK